MDVELWGTRGSIASAGPETIRYGGNTSCVAVHGKHDSVLVLDAGTGIRRLGARLASEPRRVDVFLTHLHMDHIQGLGFFQPLFRAGFDVHLWGPPSSTQALRARLVRYLSPPLFPVRLHEVDAHLEVHDVAGGSFEIDGFEVTAAPIIHPGPTLGYRVAANGVSLAYLPDHEPALSVDGSFPASAEWTSGFDLAAGVDLLIHDAQYTPAEYELRVGWGHSRVSDAVAMARSAGAARLVTYHHDPDHDDALLDSLVDEARTAADGLEVLPGREGDRYTLT